MDHSLQNIRLCNKSKTISQTPVEACETWREGGRGGGGREGESERGVGGETNRTKSLRKKRKIKAQLKLFKLNNTLNEMH